MGTKPMTLNKLKLTALVVVLSTPLLAGTAYASHELETNSAPKAISDGHMSWHEFRHELTAYPSVNAVIDSQGRVTLTGHVESSIEASAIEALASKIRSASQIINRIDSD